MVEKYFRRVSSIVIRSEHQNPIRAGRNRIFSPVILKYIINTRERNIMRKMYAQDTLRIRRGEERNERGEGRIGESEQRKKRHERASERESRGSERRAGAGMER